MKGLALSECIVQMLSIIKYYKCNPQCAEMQQCDTVIHARNMCLHILFQISNSQFLTIRVQKRLPILKISCWSGLTSSQSSPASFTTWWITRLWSHPRQWLLCTLMISHANSLISVKLQCLLCGTATIWRQFKAVSIWWPYCEKVKLLPSIVWAASPEHCSYVVTKSHVIVMRFL